METSRDSAIFMQRIVTLRRHINGLTLALDALERDLLARESAQPDGERAAEQAREVVYRQGPSEVKIIHE